MLSGVVGGVVTARACFLAALFSFVIIVPSEVFAQLRTTPPALQTPSRRCATAACGDSRRTDAAAAGWRRAGAESAARRGRTGTAPAACAAGADFADGAGRPYRAFGRRPLRPRAAPDQRGADLANLFRPSGSHRRVPPGEGGAQRCANVHAAAGRLHRARDVRAREPRQARAAALRDRARDVRNPRRGTTCRRPRRRCAHSGRAYLVRRSSRAASSRRARNARSPRT